MNGRVSLENLQELVRLCEESDAEVLKAIVTNDDGEATGGVIILRGEGTQNFLEAIESVENA